MNIDCNQFWTLLSESQLVSSEHQELFVSQVDKLAKDKGQEPDANSIASWLISNNAITKYQAEILLAGLPGPFRFGDYLVVDQIEAGPLSGSFFGKHQPTSHPVVLEFFGGSDDSALRIWKDSKRKHERASSVDHPNIVAAYDSVRLPEYRILVSQRVVGTPLCEKLPRKSRIPWKDSCVIAAQVAQGVAALHQADLVHGAISPQCIWLVKKGPAMLRSLNLPAEDRSSQDPKAETASDFLAPEQSSDSRVNFASDIYSLGCTLHRMIRGLPPYSDVPQDQKRSAHQKLSPPSLEKYEIPGDLEHLLAAMLNKDPEKRPKAEEIVNQLATLSGKAEKVLAIRPPTIPTEHAYRQSLKSRTDFLQQPVVADSAPVIQTPDAPTAPPVAAPNIAPSAAAPKSAPRKRRKQSNALIIIGSLAALSILVGVGAWIATQTEFKKPRLAENDSDNQNPDSDNTNNFDDTTIEDGVQGRLVQVFVEDDGEELWETPTTGLPLDFSYLPTGIQIAMAVRPNELLAEPEGQRILKALGPKFEATSTWLTTTCGLELDEIEQLIVGHCSTNQFNYSTSYVVRMTQPIAATQLVQLWRPQVAARDETTGVYENAEGLGYFLIPDPENPEMATGFAMGPVDQMKTVSELAGANPLSSTLSNLVSKSDAERHFNCIFVPAGLFNDEGQALLTGPWTPLRNYLRVHLPERIRCGLVSMHLDEGCYLETYIEHANDVKATDMAEQIDKFMSDSRDTIASTLAQSQPNPYWDKLRSRFAIMFNEVYQNMRVGVEGKDVLANCWLPEIAAHNLVSGAELALSFSGGSTDPVTVTPQVPATLQELLNTKRDLNVSTNPDLGLLLAGIQTSILDDYGQLPFKFEIKLMGNDLLKDGITQNQRPGDFELAQVTLGEILTEIMFRANPDKDATGPNDPACKLIWVVAEEPPGSGSPIILITTRDAAQAKGYTLPKPFQLDE